MISVWILIIVAKMGSGTAMTTVSQPSLAECNEQANFVKKQASTYEAYCIKGVIR